MAAVRGDASDEVLMVRYQRGDRDAFARLYDMYGGAAYALALPVGCLLLAVRMGRSPWLAVFTWPLVFNMNFMFGFITCCAGMAGERSAGTARSAQRPTREERRSARSAPLRWEDPDPLDP